MKNIKFIFPNTRKKYAFEFTLQYTLTIKTPSCSVSYLSQCNPQPTVAATRRERLLALGLRNLKLGMRP